MAVKFVMPELVLSAKRSVWRMHDHADEFDKVFQQLRKAVLEKSGSACRFCGFSSSKFIEVHHGDDDHKNNAPSNLYSACPLCHQVFHIGLAGMKEGGEIIYLPEMSQAELNQLALVIWMVTETDQSTIQNPAHIQLHMRLSRIAKLMDGFLMNRRGVVLLRLRAALKNTDFPVDLIDKIKMPHLGPTLFSALLMELTEDEYGNRKTLLGGLRIYPSLSRFRERNKFWMQEQNTVLPISTWYNIVPEEAIEQIVVACAEKIAVLKSSQSEAQV